MSQDSDPIARSYLWLISCALSMAQDIIINEPGQDNMHSSALSSAALAHSPSLSALIVSISHHASSSFSLVSLSVLCVCVFISDSSAQGRRDNSDRQCRGCNGQLVRASHFAQQVIKPVTHRGLVENTIEQEKIHQHPSRNYQ